MKHPEVKSALEFKPVPSPISPAKPKLLDQVRQAIRTRHYSPRTEETYVGWIKRFIFFHNKRYPTQMGEQKIARFLSSLATESHVSSWGSIPLCPKSPTDQPTIFYWSSPASILVAALPAIREP